MKPNPRLPQNPQEARDYLATNLKYLIGWTVVLGALRGFSDDAFRAGAYGFAAFVVVGIGLRFAVLGNLAPNISYRKIAMVSSAVGVTAALAFGAYGYWNRTTANQRPTYNFINNPSPAPRL